MLEPFGDEFAGFAGKSKRNEGKLSQVQLSKVNERLERFKQCKLYEFDAHVGPLNTSKNYKFHVLRQFFYYHFFPAFRGILLQSDLQHVMLLQHAMLLLGGFCPDKVSEANIREATAVLKEYNRILIAKGRVDLQTIIIHLPEDVAKFECGVECLSVFPFENFYSFFPP